MRFLGTTTWFLGNKNVVIASQNKGVAPDENTHFYIDGRPDVHPRVTYVMSSLLRDCRTGPDAYLWQLLNDLLQVDVNQRPKADEVATKLKNLSSNRRKQGAHVQPRSGRQPETPDPMYLE